MVFLLCLLFSVVSSQLPGTITPEHHPALSTEQCSNNGGCQSLQTSVVLDSNWRWVHSPQGTNCYTGDEWDKQFCPDPITCSKTCALDGADYQNVYGVVSNGTALTLKFVTYGPSGKNVGSRLYLLQDDSNYYMYHLKNREFSFTVDVSNLPCGLNGALYFVEMPSDGGVSEYPLNKAGAKFGTGYCDSQCPQDIKFINGEANILDWVPSPTDPNSGTGKYGTCCFEMDVWEANSVSNAVTPHPCQVFGQTRCEGTDCGNGAGERYQGWCDHDGCDWNPYRLGNFTFYGSKFSGIDTTQPFTVVTRWITTDGTDSGDLKEIQRVYVQNGRTIAQPPAAVPGIPAGNSITDNFCTVQKTVFDDVPIFEKYGGLTAMGKSMDQGMVLVLSLWDDHAEYMLWLDSNYPVNKSPSQPGVRRGSCATDSGIPSKVESEYPNSSVTFSNIKFGEIGSTVPLK